MRFLLEVRQRSFNFFFFNDTATTEIYTLSLHDALPISCVRGMGKETDRSATPYGGYRDAGDGEDRKSTRLNSSHLVISYAVFCLKKKRTGPRATRQRGITLGLKTATPGALH